jgi:cystathionine beta-lyase/cystathionine gamma-synthase
MPPDTARPLDLATVAVHGGREPHAPGDPVAPALSQGVNHVQAVGSPDEVLYTRYGNGPNAVLVQRRIAALEGAEASVVLASGMAATACAMLALLQPGDHLLASAWIYGGTRQLFCEEFARMGVSVTLVDPSKPRGWRTALRKETRAIFVESPVNPTCRVVDLAPISQLAQRHGIALVVDSTFASPIGFRALEHGADVVINSTTKFLNGHHDVLGGAVSGTASYVEEVRRKMVVWGPAPDPFACWLLERGLKTLALRVERGTANAGRIAAWCAAHPAVRRVHYPGLPDHPDHAIATRTLRGFGAMLALELEGGGEAATGFLRRLQLVTHAASLGGVDTLVSEPRFTSHAHLTPAQRAEAGLPDGFLRISVGIEAADDLIADLAQALA